MQEITDLRRQTAATAASPLGIATGYERIWTQQVVLTGSEVNLTRESFDVSRTFPIQDLNPASGSFGRYIGVYEDPFNRGPL